MQEEVAPHDGFDRPGLAWDGMLGLAPPHAQHRPFETRYAELRKRTRPDGAPEVRRGTKIVQGWPKLQDLAQYFD